MNLADTLKIMHAGGPGSGRKPGTVVSETKTFSGWKREYAHPDGNVTVSKTKGITRGSHTSYSVVGSKGSKSWARNNISDDKRISAYLSKHYGIEDNSPTRPVDDNVH